MGVVCGPRRPAARSPGLDPGGPPGGLPGHGQPAPHRPGVLSAPDAPARGYQWGIFEAIVGFAIGIVVSDITSIAAEAITGYKGHGNLPVLVTAASTAGLWVGLVAGAVWASKVKGTGSLVLDFGYRIGAWWDIPLGIAVGLASQYGLIPLLYLPFEHADHKISNQLGRQTVRETAAAHTPVSVIALFVFLAIGAPLVEELFFRGLLLRGLLGRIPVPIALLIDGLLFGLAHFELLQFAGLAAFGVVLAVMAWRTGRVGPGIVAHMAFNAAAVITVVHLS